MGKEYCGVDNKNHEFLGAGAIYFDWGLATETKIGITQGGSEFTDGAEFSTREADGDYAPVKGTRKITKLQPQIKVKALRVSIANITKFYAGFTSDTSVAGTTKLTRKLDLTSSYITNVAFVGGNREGKLMVVVLKNVLGDKEFALPATDKDKEIILDVQFTAHIDETFDPATASTYPYYVTFDTSAVTFTVKDLNTDPIPNATVTIDLQVGITNESGVATFNLEKGTYSYTVTHSPNPTYTGTVVVDGSTEAVAVTMLS